MEQYNFIGDVYLFDKLYERGVKMQTTAQSEKKALSNLQYRYKKEHGLTSNSKITMKGKFNNEL